MEEIKRQAAFRLPVRPARKRGPMLENAAALAVLSIGGYLAIRLADLVFRALGVA